MADLSNATINEAILAAIPDADAALCDFILWARTPFPFARVTAQDAYVAAEKWNAARARGIRLCDWCDEEAAPDSMTCPRCSDALAYPIHKEGAE